MLNCFGSSHVLTPVSRQCLKSRTFSLCLVSSRPNLKCLGSSHVSIPLSWPMSLSQNNVLTPSMTTASPAQPWANTPLPTRVITVVRSRSDSMNVHTEIRWKWAFAFRLSRSLEDIGTDTDRSETWLPIISYWWFILTMVLSRIVSEINGDFGKKGNFSYPLYLTPPQRGFQLEFCNAV